MTQKDFFHQLNELYADSRSHIVIIPGKPGLGKSSSLKTWSKDKASIYLRCDTQHDRVQIPRFSKAIQLQLPEADEDLENWENLLRTIYKPLQKNKKSIIIFDEFPKLLKSNRSFLGMLEKTWKKNTDESPLMIILCGSSMPEMNYTFLRLSDPKIADPSIVHLPFTPMDFYEFKERYPSKDIEKLIALYGITGGIEPLARKLDMKKSLEENLEVFLNHRIFTELDPKYLFHFDFHDPTTYFSILQILANNVKKIGLIAQRLQLKTHNLTSFLDRLRDLEIIERILPPTDDKPDSSRKGRYHIKDPFYRFWFSYIYPYQEILSIDRIDYVQEVFAKSYQKHMLETISQILCEKFNHKPLFPVNEIGPWWNRNGSMDLIAVGEKDILFTSIHLKSRAAGYAELDRLMENSKDVAVPSKPKKEHFLIVSKEGFTQDLITTAQQRKRIHLWTLNDLN